LLLPVLLAGCRSCGSTTPTTSIQGNNHAAVWGEKKFEKPAAHLVAESRSDD